MGNWLREVVSALQLFMVWSIAIPALAWTLLTSCARRLVHPWRQHSVSDPQNPNLPNPHQQRPLIRCRDCGLETEEVLPIGWTYLAVSGKWRCPDCASKLDKINGYEPDWRDCG